MEQYSVNESKYFSKSNADIHLIDVTILLTRRLSMQSYKGNRMVSTHLRPRELEKYKKVRTLRIGIGQKENITLRIY